jgi:hypothetical protein
VTWKSVGLLMEEDTPFGVFDREELDAHAFRRLPTSEANERNARMRERWDAGDTVQELASLFDLSERTVLRIVAGRLR